MTVLCIPSRMHPGFVARCRTTQSGRSDGRPITVGRTPSDGLQGAGGPRWHSQDQAPSPRRALRTSAALLEPLPARRVGSQPACGCRFGGCGHEWSSQRPPPLPLRHLATVRAATHSQMMLAPPPWRCRLLAAPRVGKQLPVLRTVAPQHLLGRTQRCPASRPSIRGLRWTSTRPGCRRWSGRLEKALLQHQAALPLVPLPPSAAPRATRLPPPATMTPSLQTC
jgi:hypothetical protein